MSTRITFNLISELLCELISEVTVPNQKKRLIEDIRILTVFLKCLHCQELMSGSDNNNIRCRNDRCTYTSTKTVFTKMKASKTDDITGCRIGDILLGVLTRRLPEESSDSDDSYY